MTFLKHRCWCHHIIILWGVGAGGRSSEVAKCKNCLKAVYVVRNLDAFPSFMMLGDGLSLSCTLERYSSEGKTKGLGALSGSSWRFPMEITSIPCVALRTLTDSPLPSRQEIKRNLTGEIDWPEQEELKML